MKFREPRRIWPLPRQGKNIHLSNIFTVVHRQKRVYLQDRVGGPTKCQQNEDRVDKSRLTNIEYQELSHKKNSLTVDSSFCGFNIDRSVWVEQMLISRRKIILLSVEIKICSPRCSTIKIFYKLLTRTEHTFRSLWLFWADKISLNSKAYYTKTFQVKITWK